MNVKQRLAAVVILSFGLSGNFLPQATSAPAAAPVELEQGRKPAAEDIPAARMIADPNPAFNGIAVDPGSGLVVMSDPNRKSLLLYDRTLGKSVGATSVPL